MQFIICFLRAVRSFAHASLIIFLYSFQAPLMGWKKNGTAKQAGKYNSLLPNLLIQQKIALHKEERHKNFLSLSTI
ncbi:hypothetical protein [Maridesulfovibrio sp.]|uniref:hypothetical protein n=1 Tax=Maridesulfovibrio sp. TaxID=2795000 RepID=UPI0039F04E88